MGGGISNWHKQQRKKELQKNKTARIAARDDKVKAEKSEQSVREEIKKLERQYRNAETRPHAIQSKLDRLQKELKLVQRQQQQQPRAPITVKTATFVPLSNPRWSVYYDAQLNPYGEPPPGKPRLFHRRDGGVTMNLAEAGLPGEPPPPPPRRHHQQQHRPPRSISASKAGRGTSKPDAKLNSSQNAVASSSSSKEASNKNTEKNAKAAPTKIPSLPTPSAAVLRSRNKRKLKVDIWASTEEIEYDEQVARMEEEEQQKQQWWYRDTAHQIQGPYPTDQMKQWIQAAFFPPNTPVRKAHELPWQPMARVFADCFPASAQDGVAEPKRIETATPSAETVPPVTIDEIEPPPMDDNIEYMEAPPMEEETGDPEFESRLATLRGSKAEEALAEPEFAARLAALQGEDTLQEGLADAGFEARLAALRGEDKQQGDPADAGFEARLAALRGKDKQQGDPAGAGFEARLAALRGEDKQQGGPADAGFEARLAALRGEDKQQGDPADAGFEARLAALRGGTTAVPYPVDNGGASAGAYPIDDNGPPPAYPIDDNRPPPAYPIDHNEPPPAYPIDDNGPPPVYPIDDSGPPPSYPIDNNEPAPASAYPVDEGAAATDHAISAYSANETQPAIYPSDAVNMPYSPAETDDNHIPVTEAYPVCGAYPDENETIEPSNKSSQEPKRKKAKVDKDLVAFMPSHLQNRKARTNGKKN